MEIFPRGAHIALLIGFCLLLFGSVAACPVFFRGVTGAPMMG